MGSYMVVVCRELLDDLSGKLDCIIEWSQRYARIRGRVACFFESIIYWHAYTCGLIYLHILLLRKCMHVLYTCMGATYNVGQLCSMLEIIQLASPPVQLCVTKFSKHLLRKEAFQLCTLLYKLEVMQ